MDTQSQVVAEVTTEEAVGAAPVTMDSVVIEESELNELYAGPRQDVTH